MSEHSWQPIDLTDLEPRDSIEKPAGIGLYYPGRRHLWSGEPESAKSWAALIACLQEIKAGRNAMYLDFEADAYETLDRLQALQATEPEIAKLLYMRPTEPIGTKGVSETVQETLTEYQPAIVVVDAYAGALDIHELDPNKSADIERFNRAVIEPLRATGAANIILDHLTKNRETRGRFAIGSERKVGAVDVHLGFEVVKTFGRGRTGLVHIKVHKDRPGWLTRPRLADLHLVSDPDTHRITFDIRPPADETDETGRFRPTGLMERVSRHLEILHAAVTRNAICDNVRGKRTYVLTAVDLLVEEGYASEENDGQRRLVASVEPYREAAEVPTGSPVPDRFPPVPGNGTRHTGSPVPPPFKGDREREPVDVAAGTTGSHETGSLLDDDPPPPRRPQAVSVPIAHPDDDIPF